MNFFRNMATVEKMPHLLKKIGTHNGTFHCDEVLACFLLKLLPEFRNAEIVRSRDPKILNECDIVVDVGGEFDPKRFRFDHHQKTFCESLSTVLEGNRFKTRLSSAGLVWAHFGQKIIGEVLKLPQQNPIIPVLFEKMYERFFEEIDAIDNGIDNYDHEPGKGPKYAITTLLSNRISYLNPWWNSENKDETGAFEKAMQIAGGEFLDRLKYFHECWWPARDLVQKAVNTRFEVEPSGSIMSFGDEGGFPWKEHLFELESELGIEGQLKFVLFKDTANNNWRVQTVPFDTKTFESRLPLPAEWCGLRDEELAKVSGIPGTIFCHSSGFIGGNANYEGVLEMAKRTLKSAKKIEKSETKNGSA